MTLREALLSGKRFKRPEWKGYVGISHYTRFHYQEVVALDYELEPHNITIKVTEEKLRQIVEKAVTAWSSDSTSKGLRDFVFEALLAIKS